MEARAIGIEEVNLKVVPSTNSSEKNASTAQVWD
jgi:hypothetical protein